jgi:hypothetical protein
MIDEPGMKARIVFLKIHHVLLVLSTITCIAVPWLENNSTMRHNHWTPSTVIVITGIDGSNICFVVCLEEYVGTELLMHKIQQAVLNALVISRGASIHSDYIEHNIYLHLLRGGVTHAHSISGCEQLIRTHTKTRQNLSLNLSKPVIMINVFDVRSLFIWDRIRQWSNWFECRRTSTSYPGPEGDLHLAGLGTG